MVKNELLHKNAKVFKTRGRELKTCIYVRENTAEAAITQRLEVENLFKN